MPPCFDRRAQGRRDTNARPTSRGPHSSPQRRSPLAPAAAPVRPVEPARAFDVPAPQRGRRAALPWAQRAALPWAQRAALPREPQTSSERASGVSSERRWALRSVSPWARRSLSASARRSAYWWVKLSERSPAAASASEERWARRRPSSLRVAVFVSNRRRNARARPPTRARPERRR